MTENTPRGGEPDAARLLDLARAELLNAILPQLEGEGRYRARLIAKALQIAAQELAAGPEDPEEAALRRDLAAAAGLAPGTPLRDALRSGALDGDPAVHALLLRLTDRRRAALG